SIPYSRVMYSQSIAGSCDLSPDGATLATSNCRGSFEVYPFETGRHKTLQVSGEERRPLPVLFVHHGHALITGSSAGKARLWDPATKHIHNHFNTGKGTRILAIAASHQMGQEMEKDSHGLLLATGVTSAMACDIIVRCLRVRGRRQFTLITQPYITEHRFSLISAIIWVNWWLLWV
ncbi:hypothetical protein BC629DRAFT_1578226, partial [Irpex lacteus]